MEIETFPAKDTCHFCSKKIGKLVEGRFIASVKGKIDLDVVSIMPNWAESSIDFCNKNCYLIWKRKDELKKISDNPYNATAIILGKPKIGLGTWIGYFCLIDGTGGLEIGEGCDISSGVHIYTHSTSKRCIMNKKFDAFKEVQRELIEKKPVKIGNNTFIGANATIQMGITIGDRCIIGSGSVVTKDVPNDAVVKGVPAR